MAEKVTGNCPYCGKELEIPPDLPEFSCLYCGKRSHIDLLRSHGDYREEDLLELASQLPQTLQQHDTLYKHISKKEYFPAFQAYEAEHSALLKRIDALVLSAPSRIEQIIDTLCTTFLDTLEKNLREVRGYNTKIGRSNLLFEIKVVLALFLTPLIRKLELAIAEPFCSTLHELWMKRYPREYWVPGDYTKIAEGFRKKRMCFITTAVCAREGKKDDCRELTQLRAFRDGWLRENGGNALIEEYYDIAPTLVTLIDHCGNPETSYDEIRTRWLDPCLQALEQGQREECRDTYIHMVTTLRQRYLQ